MSPDTWRKPVAGAAILALTAATLALAPTAASADVVPGNESDVGVYTNGQTDSMDIGDPTYLNVAEVAQKLAPGVDWTASSMHGRIFDKDLAAGGTDYYLDRVLGVTGTANNTVLQTRGRSLYMRGGSNWGVMGFAGSAFAGGPNSLGNFYTVAVPGQTVAEVGAQRFNAPSHAKSRYTIGTTGVVADQRKFVTHDNTAVTAITFQNPGAAAQTFTVRAASPLATGAGDANNELVGSRTLTSGANNGLVDTPWSTVRVGIKAEGFERSGANLDRVITVPAGGSVEISVVGSLYNDAMPAGREELQTYADLEPAAAFAKGVTDFNRRWAEDIPYIDVPNEAIEKAIVYRWWGERYNVLDTNEPGYVYQYPTTIEGVNLYQNSVALTQPMHLQDTKWIRTPYLPYGQILNIGELSGSSAFLDSPGHTSWNNHYSQYLGTAGLEAYNVHGGGAEIAERFAHYFEGDGVGQLEHYDGNDDKLIAYDTNYMPGNDSDAITFGYPRVNAGAPGARTIERPESAYVWGAFDAARQLYEIAGADAAKVTEMGDTADEIRDAILGRLWSDEMRTFLAGTSHGAESAPSSGSGTNPLSAAERDLIPAKESNLFDIYAEGLIPTEDAGDYVDGLRFLRYGDNFPIFPFYTANQYDRAKFGIGGSNNFSNINFTVQYRAVREALRHYDPAGKYITPEYAARLLDWMAWSIYPGGDARVANQAEYYSNWNATAKTFNRNNPNHVMLGNMNYIYVEDMGGIQPRSDDKIELWPIDLGYDHFMVNNLRYHGHDVTVVWDEDGSHYDLGQGYSLFIDGERKASADALGRFVYDPAANEIVESDAGLGVAIVSDEGADLPTAAGTPIEDDRVVEYLKTAGIDLGEDAPNLAADATLTSSFTQVGARPTPWRNFHTPGYSTGSMNYTPGAIAETERPVSLAAVTDGVTVNEPFWGNFGTTDANGYVELDFGAPKTFDNLKVWFVSDRQAGGYSQPQRYSIQVQDGSGTWVTVPDTFKSPKIVQAKFNEALFEPVTASKVRVAFVNSPSKFTAISEIQVFDSGRDVPAVVNDPPVVSASADRSRDGNLSTTLVGTATDDGIPESGQLTVGWSTVSAPEGAGVIFSDPAKLTTTVTGTAAGAYVLRLTASDGALTTQRNVEVTLAEKPTSAEFGSVGTITTSGTSSWENHSRVNEATTPTSSAPGAGNGWGNWGQPANGTSPATAAWIRYQWPSAVRLQSTEIYWYDDNGGTRMPRPDTYVIERSNDGTTWTPVELTGTSTYAGALVRNAYNRLDFEPVETSQLRIRITGVQGAGAGTGVLRWRVNGETVASVDAPVIMRTVVGEIPELPAELDVVYTSGHRGSVPFTWQPITAEQVAETNVEPFVVYGTNTTNGLIAQAQIYVRPENSQGGISIQGAEQFEQTVEVGEQPWLPERVQVSYNDGSRDNRAIGVEWDYDESLVDEPGVYTIRGELVLPSYVSTAGTTSTTLTLTVGDGVPVGPAVSATATTRCVAGKVVVVVRAVNEDDEPLALEITSAFGTKQIAAVLPGKAVSHSFTTRSLGVTAGEVTVKATAPGGATRTVEAPYSAASCG
ncbi:Ig-like domain-containing protein [Microbacterium sp. CFBP9034]|uniref:Ig-like domain-containing protein n=1 Tax=Microbacterium sp. CFBP9034 TaxID=3096540 RepID=UPI002A69CC27|nr:discoidin domain-containing protein [Microbacterium sp. CFBP9034]MDY0908607.1 discoidin domain-containing protein [Microbacterium sp. CFBP9034]